MRAEKRPPAARPLPEWRQIAEALPNIVWASRPDGKALFFNQRWYDYTGLTQEDSLADGWVRALHHDDLERTLEAWYGCVRSGAAYEIEHRFRRRDGTFRWFLGQANPVRNGSGEIVRWFGTTTDIDDQKRSKEAYALLYERERKIADTLQRALLPRVLPRVQGLTLDAVYQPDTNEANVGGDWYDAFELGDGRIAISIGDVAGHGLDAAVLMGRVREAMRAGVVEDADPGRVLQLANAAIELMDAPIMVTAVFAVIDRLTLQMVYACAGHPRPLLALIDGSVTVLEARGLPLGTGFGETWEARAIALEPGSILAFYTDGLIESDRDLEQAEARMIAALGRQARGAQRRSALSLVASTIVGKQRDDIAVLTLMTSPQPLRDVEIDLPAVPVSARRARLLLERMLREAGMPRERRFELELAVGEAVNNAIEHAHKLGSDDFVLRARRRRATIEIEVIDQGMWDPSIDLDRPYSVDPLSDRGRGLMLMRALCDDVRLERTPNGTCVRFVTPLPP